MNAQSKLRQVEENDQVDKRAFRFIKGFLERLPQ